MKIKPPVGATPIDDDDLRDLLPGIHTQEELNEFEQANIEVAERWAFKSRKLKSRFPNTEQLKLLHRRMFGLTWRWAGQFRQRDTNIGVDWRTIAQELKKLCDDVHYWVENKTYPLDELAIRFHHRLVFIHAFKNGNGRHARLSADLLLVGQGAEVFTWGSQSIVKSGTGRDAYLDALRAADKGNIQKLLRFARS